MPADHSGQRLIKPMSDKETQERSLLALGIAATSGLIKSVKSTQESCLTLCNTCRDKVPVPRLKLRHGSPPSIMDIVYPGVGHTEAGDSSRVVPHRRVLEVDWRFFDNRCYRREEDEDEDSARGEGPREEPETDARDVHHNVDNDIDISKIQWPMGTTDISLTLFNRRIDVMTWPPGLERLWLGDRRPVPRRPLGLPFTWDKFNTPLDTVTLPCGLREIFLGERFNQSIEGVAWPRGLERLSLPGFNRSIHNVQWPPGLISLEFVSPSDIGRWKCKDIKWHRETDGIDGRPSLESDLSNKHTHPPNGFLEKGVFNQSLGTSLVTSLETLWLLECFQQPLDNVAWPSGITFLGLASDTPTLFQDIIRWPPNLQHLCMADKPDPDDRFIYPPDCDVTILMDGYGAGTSYNIVQCYDRDENPNDVSQDDHQYNVYDGDNDRDKNPNDFFEDYPQTDRQDGDNDGMFFLARINCNSAVNLRSGQYMLRHCGSRTVGR